MNFSRIRTMAFGAGGLLAAALFAGRLSGLLRELLLASRFGVSLQADVAVVLLTLPDLMVNLLLSGGLSAALVPQLRALPPERAGGLFRSACLCAMAVFSIIALVVAVWPQAVFALFAPGLPQSAPLVHRDAMTLLALSIPLTAISGVTAAYLNAEGRFFIPGLGTFIFNLAIIAGLAAWRGGDGLFALTAMILAGAVFRLSSQAVILPREGWRARSGVAKPERCFVIAFFAGIAAASLTMLPPAVIRAAASLLGPGSVATFNYAQKLVELPVGILITTTSTIALTRLSGHYANGDIDAARRVLRNNVRFSLLLALMIVAVGEFLADPVIKVILQRGALDSDAAGRIAQLTRIILLGVPFIALSSLSAAALNAQLRTPEVLRITAISIVVLMFLALPGLLLRYDLALMGAVVGSQASLAWMLARRVGICLWGAAGIVDGRSLAATGIGLFVAVPVSMTARAWDSGNGIVAIVLGGTGFIAAVAASAAIARR